MDTLRTIILDMWDDYMHDGEYFGVNLLNLIHRLEEAEKEIKKNPPRSVNVKGSVTQSVIITGDQHVL